MNERFTKQPQQRETMQDRGDAVSPALCSVIESASFSTVTRQPSPGGHRHVHLKTDETLLLAKDRRCVPIDKL